MPGRDSLAGYPLLTMFTPMTSERMPHLMNSNAHSLFRPESVPIPQWLPGVLLALGFAYVGLAIARCLPGWLVRSLSDPVFAGFIVWQMQELLVLR